MSFAEVVGGRRRGQRKHKDQVGVQCPVHQGGWLSCHGIEVALDHVESVIRSIRIQVEIPNAESIAQWIGESHLFEQQEQRCRLQITKISGLGSVVDPQNGQWVVRKSTRLNSSHANISYAVF